MERIVIVDEDDNYIGEEEKGKCHEGNGILHRAILVMVLNEAGELLLAQRSEEKLLWPGYWDGTVASHVWKGEDWIQASKRRLVQEIGLETDKIKYLFKFRYHVKYKTIGAENEICAVMLVEDVETDKIFPRREEISALKTMTPNALTEDISNNKNLYTPWLILAIEYMNRQRLVFPGLSRQNEVGIPGI